MLIHQKLIKDIQDRLLGSDREFVLDSLKGALDRLQKAFPQYGSFLMEFIQNADDAKSQSLKIEILLDTNIIRIYNDGLPFNEEDVKSICKIGRSSKTPKDYIGYLGVGFKAVFLISECVEIYSGDFRFKFDKNAWENSDHTPWQIIPISIDNQQTESLGRYRTLFNIHIKNSELAKLIEEVSPAHISDRTLLFLRNIKEIEIIVQNQFFYERKIVKSTVSKTESYEIYLIEEYFDGNLKSKSYWLIFRSVCNVPYEVKEDPITKNWERENVEKREVLVAFKLDDNYNLVIEKKGTAHIGVFSFLPLKEISSGLNFLIQADFLTTAGRGELLRESSWNIWLAKEIYNLIINKCIPIFLENERWKLNFTEILYPSEGGHELFEEYIKKPLRKYLEENKVLIAEDGSLAKAEELVEIGENIKELLADEDLKIIFTDKKILHKSCKPASIFSSKIDKIYDLYAFLQSPEGERLLKYKTELRDIEWFKKLYRKFLQEYNEISFALRGISYKLQRRRYNESQEYYNFWNRLSNSPIPMILTKDYNLSQIDECYTISNKLIVPEEIRDRFRIVHPELAKDEDFKQFVKRLNEARYSFSPHNTKVIRELTEEDIKGILEKQEILKLNKENWESFSEDERIDKIKRLKYLWESNYVSLANYNFLTLKSKSGKWIRPEELVFSQEYKPDHNLEELVKKELLDLSLEFLSPEFIKNVDKEDEIRKWYKFFKELGVDKIIEDKKEKIVQRIGILSALKYEKEKGRSARELGESEQQGYDIVSKSASEERYIEVKGTSATTLDIFLTVNEFKTLKDKDKSNKYFVYVVVDALRKPTLYVVQGDKLLEIEDIKVIIQFNKWINIAKIDEFRL